MKIIKCTNIFSDLYIFLRRTCSIQFPDKLFMIGGYGSDRAFEYNENVRDNVSSFPVKRYFCQGFVRELPRMSHAHDYAGCGSFEYNNETVKYAVKSIKLF